MKYYITYTFANSTKTERFNNLWAAKSFAKQMIVIGATDVHGGDDVFGRYQLWTITD